MIRWWGQGLLKGPGGDAAVIILEECQKALAISMDGNSRYVVLNPYLGGLITVAEATRNVICSGARPLALTDGLNMVHLKSQKFSGKCRNQFEEWLKPVSFYHCP